MKTFMSLTDLGKLADGGFPDHLDNPEEHGFIALVEPGDVNRELDDIEMPRLTDIRHAPRRTAPGADGCFGWGTDAPLRTGGYPTRPDPELARTPLTGRTSPACADARKCDGMIPE